MNMKTFAIAFAILAVTALVSPAQVPVAVTARNVKVEKIAPTVVGTPEFTVANTPPKRSTFQKWLEIEVEFSIEGIELVDELSFKFDVLLGTKLYTGDITHVNIPKGRERFTVMYISPRNLDRITGGKPFNPAMIDNIWVTISKQGQALAISSIKDKSGRLPVPNAQQFPGLLTPKSETPFSVLWTDRYEAVKLPNR